MDLSDADLLALCAASETFAEAMENDLPANYRALRDLQAEQLARDLRIPLIEARLYLAPVEANQIA